MSKTIIPKGYQPILSVYDTQRAIEFVKKEFQNNLRTALNLHRVSAPLFVREDPGLNDNLNGYERPVGFDIPAVGCTAQVVHSLAKWKRLALKRYDFNPGNGLYADMNAIRRDEELDNLHSAYVDQWDWEKVITREERNVQFLKATVQNIVGAIYATAQAVEAKFGIKQNIAKEITFITSQELENLYPDLDAAQRECEFAKTHHTFFLMQIGDNLASGKPHDGRAPDYDDWQLNGDLIFWYPTLERQIEISSMGIRVDAQSLKEQLAKANCPERAELPFHKALLNDELPLTIGGGIGQSRLCMFLLHCAHIGEVQVSIWDEETIEACRKSGINLL